MWTSQERLRCVIVEKGSLPLVEADAAGYDETLVIAQMKEELPGAFAERVRIRLGNLERAGRYCHSAVMLVGTDNDPGVLAARRATLLGLSRYLRASGSSADVTLVTGCELASEDRAGLLELADALLTLPSSLRVPIKLRFGHQRAA